jgi:hypothetical protein
MESKNVIFSKLWQKSLSSAFDPNICKGNVSPFTSTCIDTIKPHLSSVKVKILFI